MRVPELCLYFPIILLVFVFGFAYFARTRVSLLRPGQFRPRAVFVFLCTFLVLTFLPG